MLGQLAGEETAKHTTIIRNTLLQAERNDYLELCIDTAPAKISQSRLGWWSQMSWIIICACILDERNKNKTDSPIPEGIWQYTQHYARATHTKERALPFRSTSSCSQQNHENRTERCSTEVLCTGYLQQMAHLRAKTKQGRSQPAASPHYAINTRLVTTNACILCNESKTAFVVGKIPSVI